MLHLIAVELYPESFLTRLREDKDRPFPVMPLHNNIYIRYRHGEQNDSELYQILYDPLCLYASEFFYTPEDTARFARLMLLEFFTIKRGGLPFENIEAVARFLFQEVFNYCFRHGAVIPQKKSILPQLDNYVDKRKVDAIMAKKLKNFIEALPELRKNIIKLWFLDGLSCEEISEKLNVPLPAVKKHRLDALRKMNDAETGGIEFMGSW